MQLHARLSLPLLFVLLLAALAPGLRAQAPQPDLQQTDFGSLAPTPPMGWASWNHFFCDYDERTIRAQADALVATGMRDAGYRYVVIQECIARERDPQGNLIADSARFPSGVPALTAYIHKLGLRAGTYTDVGRHTCYPNPRYQGSYGHEQQDADTFAKWGMDFVEMDYCNREEAQTGRWVYERMAEAIRRTGRPMIFYLCAWGNEQPWEWAQGRAQMWRTEFDISLEKNHVSWDRMVRNFESNTVHSVFSAPESWNDADMLEIGNPGLNDAQGQAQMSMWVISPSPLLAGADLTAMSTATRATYGNREAIAINQDSLGAGAERLGQETPGVEVWARPLTARTSGEAAAMLLNATDAPAAVQLKLSELDLAPGARVRDVWAARDLPVNGDLAFHATVPARSSVLLRISGKRAWRQPVQYEAEWPGNGRSGRLALLSCGECSHGYAEAIGGAHEAGSLTLRNVRLLAGGRYLLRLTYVRNGLEDKQIGVAVNGAAPVTVTAIMRSWNYVDVPVELRSGANTISVSYTGERPFYLDSLDLQRPRP